jgi:polysaccharide export outer membrane protein
MPRRRISTFAAIILGVSAPAFSQEPVQPQKSLERRPDAPPRRAPTVPTAPAASSPSPAKQATPREAQADYILGPDDQVSFWTPEAEELNGKVLRIEGNGSMTVPLVGTLKAAGLTASQLSTEVSERLKKYYLKPQVVISVMEYRSQPVSVIGAVNTPGVHQVQGRKTLVEMLSLAGGLKEDAGPKVVVTRRADWGLIPAEGATMDPSGSFSTVEIDLKAVTSAQRPQDNIQVKPNDIISVPKARLIYVVGEVQRPGGFVLTDRDALSVLQALSMAGGLKTTASAKSAAVIHNDESGPQERTQVNLSEVLSGKASDLNLQADDILYVPDSKPKRAAFRAAEAAVQALTGVAIWRVGSR